MSYNNGLSFVFERLNMQVSNCFYCCTLSHLVVKILQYWIGILNCLSLSVLLAFNI